MQKSVNAADVNKCAVFGQIFYRSFNNVAFFDIAERDGFLFINHRIGQHFTRKHDVVAAAAEFDNFRFDVLSPIRIEVANRARINLRTGQKRFHAVQVNPQSAFGFVHHATRNRSFFVESLFDFVPRFATQSVKARKCRRRVARVNVSDNDFNFIALLNRNFAFVGRKFFSWHNSFGFVAKIHHHAAVRHADDFARYQFARMINCLLLLEFFENRTKIFTIVRLFFIRIGFNRRCDLCFFHRYFIGGLIVCFLNNRSFVFLRFFSFVYNLVCHYRINK